ncbi:hypothetical protein [Streptomyces lavendulae]|uniref:hypothetical protein n=1 Tax=Streptomyces lavendulae TaxID=1914 RepID=UPI0031ECB582
MKHTIRAFATAFAFVIASHTRNRLAVVLAVFFLPTWIWLVREVTYVGTLHFHLPALARDLSINSNHMNQTANALNAATLILGFMMFMATHKSGDLDRRLVLAGFPRGPLLCAKAAGMVLVSAAVGLYGATILMLLCPVRQPVALAMAATVACLVYGAIGIMLGMLLRGELEGMFLIIMTSLVDVSMQNPSVNASLDQPGLELLPLYAPQQLATAAVFTGTAPWSYALLGLCWFIVTCTAAWALFHVRTRSHSRRAEPAMPSPRTNLPAAVGGPAGAEEDREAGQEAASGAAVHDRGPD